MFKIITILCFVICPLITYAQTSIVTGQILDGESYEALPGASVLFPRLKAMVTTDSSGKFSLQHIPFGKHDLVISYGRLKENIKVIIADTITGLGVLTIRGESEIPAAYENPNQETIVQEGQNEDDNTPYISSILNASRDIYLSAAAFNLGTFRYQVRGYKRDQQEVYMNGLLLNDVESGMALWSQWGGLNDAFRNQYTVLGLGAADAGMGGLMGITTIDATAINQRKQVRATYSLSNRNYNHRIMLTYSSGLLKGGWAFSLSASTRWAGEGYIPGTFFKSYSWYAALSKQIGTKHFIHITTFGSPTIRGKTMAATKEAMNIAGDNYYNPNWGYLNGDRRNARINQYFQPAIMLNYEYKPNITTLFRFSALYQHGYTGNSIPDWYNAQDPRPDYYRKLPSYYLNNAAGADSTTANIVRQELLADPEKMQINWDRIYQANMLNKDSINGISGNRSLYVIGEDVDYSRRFSIAANYQKTAGRHFAFYVGESLTIQNTESYRRLQDLLGGDFYVNLNQFAEQSYPGNVVFNQNDLNNRDGIIQTGDRYNYNYKSHFLKLYAWGQVTVSFNKMDIFLSGRAGLDIFTREGIFRNGLFPERSQGKSFPNNFFSYAAKAGLTFKINGRNYLALNGITATAPPTFDNTFISPRTRNDIIQHPSVEKIYGIEGGYLLRSPSISGRLTGYVSDIRNITEIKRFYHEDYRTFVNYVMQPVNIRHIGAEFALKIKITAALSSTIAASWKQVFYTNRPAISIYKDNDTSSNIGKSICYIHDFYVAAGPQSAYSVSFNYSSPQFWYANITGNYSDRNYIDINPSRRTTEALDLVTTGSSEWSNIMDQEKLPAAFTLDLFAGKSFMLSKSIKWLPFGTYLYINLGINNILNNKNIITGGFEQLRYDYSNRNPNRFPSKYFYAQGINYFLNVSIKF